MLKRSIAKKISRVRDKGYLRHVREWPCLSCDLYHHSIAHHVQFAEGHKAMALKVSDEWAVPLCTPCHVDLHASGDERLWWDLRGTDPLEWCKHEYENYKAKNQKA